MVTSPLNEPAQPGLVPYPKTPDPFPIQVGPLEHNEPAAARTGLHPRFLLTKLNERWRRSCQVATILSMVIGLCWIPAQAPEYWVIGAVLMLNDPNIM